MQQNEHSIRKCIPEYRAKAVVTVVEKMLWRWVTGSLIVLLLLTGGGVEWWESWNAIFKPASMERRALALPNKPNISESLVVYESNDPDQVWFSDDIPEAPTISTTESLNSMGSNVGAAELNAITPLHLAVIQGEFDLVQWLLANGSDVNVKYVAGSHPGETPLHSVAYAGHTQIAELLLAYGAIINATDQYSYTPLRRAMEQGHQAMAELLVNKGANIVTTDASGMTLLHVVARTDHVELARFLIAGGIDVNAMDNLGFTPLDYAQGSEIRMAETLERHGALCTIC